LFVACTFKYSSNLFRLASLFSEAQENSAGFVVKVSLLSVQGQTSLYYRSYLGLHGAKDISGNKAGLVPYGLPMSRRAITQRYTGATLGKRLVVLTPSAVGLRPIAGSYANE
jgi:hypothetical protein